MAKSQAELVIKVLENLGVQAVGQVVSNEDSDAVIRAIQPKIEELNARDVGYIPYDADSPDNALDDVYFLAFAKILAWELADTFGVTADKQAKLKVSNDAGEETIRDIVRPQGTKQMLNTEPGNWNRRYGTRWWV